MHGNCLIPRERSQGKGLLESLPLRHPSPHVPCGSSENGGEVGEGLWNAGVMWSSREWIPTANAPWAYGRRIQIHVEDVVPRIQSYSRHWISAR
jgi:hypothetical protein